MLTRNRVIPVGNVHGFWPYESGPEQLGPTAGSIIFGLIRERRKGAAFADFEEARDSVRRDFPWLFPKTRVVSRGGLTMTVLVDEPA